MLQSIEYPDGEEQDEEQDVPEEREYDDDDDFDFDDDEEEEPVGWECLSCMSGFGKNHRECPKCGAIGLEPYY